MPMSDLDLIVEPRKSRVPPKAGAGVVLGRATECEQCPLPSPENAPNKISGTPPGSPTRKGSGQHGAAHVLILSLAPFARFSPTDPIAKGVRAR